MNQKNLPVELKSGNFLEGIGQYALRAEQVKYEPCFFAFLDILGYKQLLQNLGVEAPWYFYEILKNTFEFHHSSYESVEVKLLSDSILVWSKGQTPVHFWNVVNVVDLIRQSFFKKKLLLRGGITEGLNFIDQDIIISPALVKAYQLEQEAKVPRILIFEAAVSLATKGIVRDSIGQAYIQVGEFARHIHVEQIENDSDGKKILKSFSESNGTYFIKTGRPIYFNPGDAAITSEQGTAFRSEGESDLHAIRKQLLDMRPTDTDAEVLRKYSYVVGKFNSWMGEFGSLGMKLKIEQL